MSRRFLGLLGAAAVVGHARPQRILALQALGRVLIVTGVIAFIAGKLLAVALMPPLGFIAAFVGGLFLLVFQLGANLYGWAAVSTLCLVMAACVAVVSTGG